MDRRGQRPPRSARPPQPPPSQPPPSDFDQPHAAYRPPMVTNGSSAGISFQSNEFGDRQDLVDQDRRRAYTAYNNNQLSPGSPVDPAYAEAGVNVGRKKSLVRPDREKIEPGHRLWHYRNHAAQMEDQGGGNAMPSSAYYVLYWTLFN